MSIRTMTAFIIMIVAATQLTFTACKKKETTGNTPQAAPEQHAMNMVKKSFEESKKVTAATVNGEAITMFALFREMNAIAPNYVKQGQQRTPEIDETIRKDALNISILTQLAVQEAKKRGMKVAPETIDGVIKNLKANAGSENAYREQVESQGLTEDELRKTIEQASLFEMIAAQEITAKIKVTDADLKARYKKEKAGLKDEAHRQITFEAAKGMLEQRAKAEAEEKRMLEWEKELKKGARIEIVEQKRK